MLQNPGIYVHIPFCAQKCRYCDFYSAPYSAGLAGGYIDTVINQLGAFARAFPPRRAADTLYFGGGTPSLLPARNVGRVIDAAALRLGLAPGSEITLELNPETASPQKLRDLRAAGVTRISVGLQSADDGTLGLLGRRHTAAQGAAAIHMAREAGFDNISADIMLALPGEDERTLGATLDYLAGLPLTHVSAYILKIMEGTPFGAQPPDGIPDGDEQARLYELCCARLAEMGFAQYEISNFSRPGFESRHNLKYWDNGDYYGLGAAAHSSLGGRRYSFPGDTARFTAVYIATDGPDPRDTLDFEGEVTPQDYIMLRLRTAAGLSLNSLYDRYNYRLKKQHIVFLESCRRQGLLSFDGETAALTVRGMLVSNAIISSLI